ncbi:MAG TPA: outer membrane protein assembly factor BamA [Sedimentisphaerales bacterium]|nr:outer membrane protein assembly factor BamA [Sedimentisphaerales bacterium]
MNKSYIASFISLVLLMSLGLAGCAAPEAKQTAPVRGKGVMGSVDFDFADKRTFKEKTLLGIMGFKKVDYIDQVLARLGREHLEEFYLKKGFAFAGVELDEKKLPDGKMLYTYKITEGPRVKVAKVVFSGNKAMKTKTLKDAIKASKKKWLLWAKDYSEETVAEDVRRLEDTYWNGGFLNYSITAKKDFSDDKRKVRITYMIDEGPVYTVEKLALAGAGKIYGIDIDGRFDEASLLAMLKLKPGEIYRELKAQSDAKLLRQLYREHGFVDAEVELLKPEFVPDTNAVNVKFEITEGGQFRIGRIDITGNKQTQDKVIRRILDSYDFQPGKLYDAEAAPKEGGGQLEEEIQRTIMAEEVSVTPLVGAESGQKKVEVNIKEGQTGFAMLGAGVGSDSGLIGQLVLEQRNFDIKNWPKSFGEFITGQAFKGAGQTFRIALQPGTELSEHSVSFTEPYWQDKPIALDVVGSSWERERESYEEDRLKGYFGFRERYEKRYRERWRRSIDFRVENVDVGDIDLDAPREIKDVEGGNALVGVKLGVGKDLTDNRFTPSKGDYLTTSYEQVSGDYTFGVLSGTYIRYSTIHEDLAERKTILATKLHAATVLGDAPPFEKFYAGGMTSIRGFEYRGVSTRGRPEVGGVPVVGAKRKDPIGSDWIFLANAEVAVPLIKEDFAALFFIDSGAIDSGGYRASVGTGLQIMIPQWFGPVPMRVGVAAPFLKDESDDTQTFFFYVGRLF